MLGVIPKDKHKASRCTCIITDFYQLAQFTILRNEAYV